MQIVEISVVKSSGFWVQSWFSGLTWESLSAPVTRCRAEPNQTKPYLNAEIYYANTNDLLIVAFRCRKPFVNR